MKKGYKSSEIIANLLFISKLNFKNISIFVYAERSIEAHATRALPLFLLKYRFEIQMQIYPCNQVPRGGTLQIDNNKQ